MLSFTTASAALLYAKVNNAMLMLFKHSGSKSGARSE
jgi:hypothetical protein